MNSIPVPGWISQVQVLKLHVVHQLLICGAHQIGKSTVERIIDLRGTGKVDFAFCYDRFARKIPRTIFVKPEIRKLWDITNPQSDPQMVIVGN